jgi:hypothetical protein
LLPPPPLLRCSHRTPDIQFEKENEEWIFEEVEVEVLAHEPENGEPFALGKKNQTQKRFGALFYLLF